MKPLRVGIIGIGFGQHVHLPAFRQIPDCEVLAICASTQSRAQAIADKHRIPLAYGQWQDLVQRKDLDIISIAVPAKKQLPMAEVAIQEGKHIFCEKPLGGDPQEWLSLAKVAEQKGLKHGVDFEFTEIPIWQKARLSWPSIAPLRHILVNWHLETYAHKNNLNSWKTQSALSGGTLNLFASHTLYYLEWVFGPIQELSAQMFADETLVQLQLRLHDGTPAMVSLSTNSFHGGGHRIEVFGEKGQLSLKNQSSDHINGFELELNPREGESRKLSSPAQNEDGRIVAVHRLLSRFVHSIQTGQSLSPNLRDGCRVERLMQLTRQSNLHKQFLRCDQWDDDFVRNNESNPQTDRALIHD